MDEDWILDVVQRCVDECIHEIRSNRVYSVSDRGGAVDKMQLKSRLGQGSWDAPYTEVRISVGDGVRVDVENSPVYIYGEYIKMSRNMTQSPLRIKGVLRCERSVSDFCTQVKTFFDARDVTFIPAGREDLDVRMIEGRPFLLEVKSPRRNLECRRMDLTLHEDVDIVNLRMVGKECKKAIFSGEGESRKMYRMFLCTREELDVQEMYAVEQKTPLRVLHRRANAVRHKEIRVAGWESRCEDGWFYYLMTLEASAGAYIKEFVNGDLGRTTPSLRTQTNCCDLLELDVLRVEKRDVDVFSMGDIELRKYWNKKQP